MQGTLPGFQRPANALKSTKRIVWIDQLRGFAFLLVIIGHSLSKSPLKNWIYSFHMPLFFIITGLTLNIDKLLKTGFFAYLKKNFSELIVPYFWLYFFLIPLEWLRVEFICQKAFNPLDYVLGFLAGNNNVGKLVSIPLYFLPLLFLSKLAVWLVVRLTRGNRILSSIIFTVLLCAWPLFKGVDTFWHISCIPAVTFLIYSGSLLMALYKKYKKKLKVLKPLLPLLISAVLFAAGAVINKFNGRVSLHHSSYGKNLLFFLVAAFSTSVAFALIITRLPPLHLFGFFGKYSLFCLGIHFTVIKYMTSVFPVLEEPLWAFPVKTAATLPVLIPLALLFDRIAPYLAGKRTVSSAHAVRFFKYTSIIWVSFTFFVFAMRKYLSLFNHTLIVAAAATVLYLGLCVVFTAAANRFFPGLFLQIKPPKTESAHSEAK